MPFRVTGMHLHNGKFIRTDMWREGKYLDLWSVPHFLSGIVVGWSLYAIGFGFKESAVISFLLLVLWECFELFAEIEEGWINRGLDVVVGMVSFAPTFALAMSFTNTQFFMAFGAVVAADGALSAFGWVASHKAAVLEKKLLAEFHEQQDRLREKRGLLRKRLHERRRRWRMARKWWHLRERHHNHTDDKHHVSA